MVLDLVSHEGLLYIQDEDGNPLETEYGLSTYKDHQTFTIQVTNYVLYAWTKMLSKSCMIHFQVNYSLTKTYFCCRKCQRKPQLANCLALWTLLLIMTWLTSARYCMGVNVWDITTGNAGHESLVQL